MGPIAERRDDLVEVGTPHNAVEVVSLGDAVRSAPLATKLDLPLARLQKPKCRDDPQMMMSKTSSSGLVDLWDFIRADDDDSTQDGSSASPDSNSRRSSNRAPNGCEEMAGCLGSNEVPAEHFLQPCCPMSTAGGTAAFFRVRYSPECVPAGIEPDFYLGKDLQHAADELEFYDKLRMIKETDAYWAAFGEIALECPGIAKLQCFNPKSRQLEDRALLLLQNLQLGFEKMRLLDVKMGAETSIAGWKGKSRLHAWKNACVDQRTNSAVEGYRLEGMELPPRALEERLALVVATRKNRTFPGANLLSDRAAKRFLLQKLRAHEFLASWLDVSMHGAGAELHAHGAVWSALPEVGRILNAVVDIPAPQLWIGSSLALGVEVCRLDGRPKVVAKVFDWGRAELTSAAEHASLQPEDKKERVRYWRQYVRALCRFHWELCRLAAHRCCCPSWSAFVFELHREEVGLVRAAVFGESTDSTVSVGMYQLPRKAIGPGSNLVLPLVSRSSRTPTSRPFTGMLCVQISTTEGGNSGECCVSVSVRGTTYGPGEDMDAGVVMTVRVIAFERVGDARLHVEAWRDGLPENVPKGHATEQRTAPGKVVAGQMFWADTFEFLGLGKAGAAEAQAKLAAAMPLGVHLHSRGNLLAVQAACSECSKTSRGTLAADEGKHDGSNEDTRPSSVASSASAGLALPGGLRSSSCCNGSSTPWPELLPPTVGKSQQAEIEARRFCLKAVPWADEGAPCPPHWL